MAKRIFDWKPCPRYVSVSISCVRYVDWCAASEPDGTCTDIQVTGQYYPRSESTVTVLHRHERNKSLQSNRDTIGSQPKPAGDPFSLSLAPRQEGYALRQPVASTFRGSKEASAQSSTLGSQKTSTDVSASEQTKWYIWDAFDLLRTVLVDLAEPTTSDLLCLSHLEDRLSHLAPKEHPSAEPIRRPLDFPM